MRYLILNACFAAALLAAGELPVALSTAGGSRLHGLLTCGSEFVLTNTNGTRAPIEIAKIKRIAFGPRVDPNLENDALVALNDLQSEKYDVREKALAKLRKLGSAALRPLRLALKSPDAEVAARARSLLGEFDALNVGDVLADTVVLSDDTVVHGELDVEAFVLRSRWGVLKFPMQAVSELEVLKATEISIDALPAAGQAPKAVPLKTLTEPGDAAARWDLDAERGEAQANPEAFDLLPLGLRVLGVDRRPGKGAQQKEARAGDRLEQVYAPWGALLKASEAAAKVEASETEVFGSSRGLSLQAKNSDLEVAFIMPGSFNAKERSGRPGGVGCVGAIVKAGGAGLVGLAVYDRSGRQLAQVLNRAESNVGAGGVVRDELLAIRSKIPIVRARFFRVDPAKQPDIVLDDLLFDRIAGADRAPGQCSVWLNSGERLACKLEPNDNADTLKLLPEFLPPGEPAAEIALSDIERFEPASAHDAEARRSIGTPHGVLLQSGESFRARLSKMDENEVEFLLPGGAQLRLPRLALRKIDLQPEPPPPGELSAPTAVAADEKPGVEFISKPGEDPKNKPDPKQPDPNNPAQGLSRMDDVEIVGVNPVESELTIRDKLGEMTIGLPMVRTLVFRPAEKALTAGPKFRDCILSLYEGSRFEVFLVRITADEITAEMAGGTVKLPSRVVTEVQRKKR